MINGSVLAALASARPDWFHAELAGVVVSFDEVGQPGAGEVWGSFVAGAVAGPGGGWASWYSTRSHATVPLGDRGSLRGVCV